MDEKIIRRSVMSIRFEHKKPARIEAIIDDVFTSIGRSLVIMKKLDGLGLKRIGEQSYLASFSSRVSNN